MKLILAIMFVIICSFSAAAFLGIYEPGETVRFSIVCLEDSGRRDAGCTLPSAVVVGPFEESSVNVTQFNETNEQLMPGLWRGNYSIGAGNQTGLWSIYINLTNSNGTAGATVIQFQVVGDGRGIDNTGANVVTALSNQAVIQAAIKNVNDTVKDNAAVLNSSIFSINTSIVRNLSNDRGFFDPLFVTANTSIIRNLSNDRGFFNPFFVAVNDSVVKNLSNDKGFFDSLLVRVNDSLYNYISNVNISILLNISRSGFSSSVSSADQVAIGKQCAMQTIRQNLTIDFMYNFTNNSFELLNAIYNYSSFAIIVNETYHYNNLSMLNKTVRNTTNG